MTLLTTLFPGLQRYALVAKEWLDAISLCVASVIKAQHLSCLDHSIVILMSSFKKPGLVNRCLYIRSKTKPTASQYAFEQMRPSTKIKISKISKSNTPCY